ncbi:MAG: hypothetical protein ACPGLV_10640 [Bacteroidia bacterium]
MVKIRNKKAANEVSKSLDGYLKENDRAMKLPLDYNDLLHFSNKISVYNKYGEDTLWYSVNYDQSTREMVHDGLKHIYALLKTDGNMDVIKHLEVERIDFCSFGNSQPFRIRIINKFNDNYDHYYVKKTDANRIYGLELEDLLSPNRFDYLVYNKTLIEEHVAGLPGDQFIEKYVENPNVEINKVRIAKEFIKFNERCSIRLLGDMRAYNYVVDITPDFEDTQYRVRAIDFDQECYEGHYKVYLPQFFKDNNAIVNLVISNLNPNTQDQYREEERTLLFKRYRAEDEKLKLLLNVMEADVLSPPQNVTKLAKELNAYHNTNIFRSCHSMGSILKTNLKLCLGL